MEFGMASSRVFNGYQFSFLCPSPRKFRTTADLSSLPPRLRPLNASFLLSTPVSRRYCTCKATLKETNAASAAMVRNMAANDFELSSLTALSPLDGRYWRKVKDLAPYTSEYGLDNANVSHIRIIGEGKKICPVYSESSVIDCMSECGARSSCL